jgi:zinc ribbon protein
VASCANCGAKLPKNSRYCPQCGHASGSGETKVMEVPPDETGPVPVHYTDAEPRYYGVTPATLVLVLAGAALTLAVVLLATGRWPLGLIVLGVSVLLVLVFVEAARRRPDGLVARSTAEALDGFRTRAGVAADSLATRGRAAGRLIGLRREVRRMAALRAQLLFELGDAVYRGDEQGTETAREQVKELDELAAQRESEMQSVVDQAQERLQQRRLEIQPTEMVELPDEPVRPGEGDPGPVRIPEPYPPPDEGSPPQPAIIPEPGPLPDPDAPEGEGR